MMIYAKEWKVIWRGNGAGRYNVGYDLIRKLPYDHPYRYDGREFGGPRLWTPSQISAIAWFDAYDEDTITESSGSVSQWNDKSGNGYHFTQGTGSFQPTTGTRTIGGLNALDFDGTDDRLESSALASFLSGTDTPIGLYAVIRTDDLTVSNVYFGLGHSSGVQFQNWFQFVTNTNFRTNKRDDLNVLIFVESVETTAQDTNEMIVTLHDGTSNIFRVNGVSEASASQDVGACTFSSAMIGGFLLSGVFTTAAYNGLIAEIIITDNSESLLETQTIEGYLAHKWGLDANLPGGHPYLSVPPTV